MSSPTQGPWINDGSLVIGSERGDICWMGVPASWSGGKPDMCINADANAKLIAAAPDLLAALQCALDAANEMELSSAHFPRVMIEAAIAKATP